MKTVLFLIVVNVLLLFSCTDEYGTNNNDQQKMSKLKEKYKLNKIEEAEASFIDLQATSIDSLTNFLENFQKLKGVKIPIKMESNKTNNYQLVIDTKRLNIPHIKTRSETVLVSEMLFVSLATLRMNVWLDISIPSVVTSELTGLTVFDRWEQKSADARKTSNIINFNVYGVWYYKIFVDGIGDVYSYSASFSGTYNINTNQGDLNVL